MPKGANQTKYRKMHTIIPDTCSWTRVILLRLHCSSGEVAKPIFFLLAKEVRDDKMRRIFRKNSSFEHACLVVVHRV